MLRASDGFEYAGGIALGQDFIADRRKEGRNPLQELQMLRRLFRGRHEEQHDVDHVVVKSYSFPRETQDQFRCREIIDAQVRDGDAVANVTEAVSGLLDSFVS